MTKSGERLAEAIAFRNTNPTQLAKRCGVGQTTIQRIIDGFIKNPREDTIERIAQALSIDFVWLRTGAGTMIPTYPILAPNPPLHTKETPATYILPPQKKYGGKIDPQKLREWEDALGWLDENDVREALSKARQARQRFEKLKKIHEN
ncbi:MAG: helix-turn-helix domain-containing protein [Casimicrobium sp.]